VVEHERTEACPQQVAVDARLAKLDQLVVVKLIPQNNEPEFPVAGAHLSEKRNDRGTLQPHRGEEHVGAKPFHGWHDLIGLSQLGDDVQAALCPQDRA
jgi:hypothetical protein